mmetsp:Transcript_14004/g.29555  ORF Transcript_14004/g.29555 Transcript_14004/m.29555 type:complete len:358 (+) Transcript_14004:3-1076(+)
MEESLTAPSSMAGTLDRETLVQIIENLDADRNGRVSKDEFRLPYMKLFPKMTLAQYDEVWKKIDLNGDGSLSVTELGAYYGFHLSPNGVRGSSQEEMSDEQIMEALKLQSTLAEMQLENSEKAAKELASTKKTEDLKLRSQAGITAVRIPTDGRLITDPQVLYLQACAVGDTAEIKKAIESKTDLRVQDIMGEMALHKLAKLNDTANLELVLKHSNEADLEWPDKNGNTPLLFAAFHGSIDVLNLLLDKGANFLHQNLNGSTCLHAAVNSNNEKTVQALLVHPKIERHKLLNMTDKSKRTAVHIASYRSNEDLVKTLMIHGADINSLDFAGNAPVALAKKGGRRKSRDLLEGITPLK